MTTHQRWDRETIRQLLRRNATARRRALMLLYAEQTRFEQGARATIEPNRCGFGAHDAETLSRIAERIRRGDSPTSAQDLVLRDALPKYWKQILCAIAKKHETAIEKRTQTYVILGAPT